MAINDVFRVQVNMQAGSQPSMNILHLREVTARGGTENGAENVTELVGDFYTALATSLSEDWRVISIRASQIAPIVPGPPAVTIFGGAESIEGAVASHMVPSNSPLVISLYSNISGRKGRGRIYLPGIPESVQADGQITNAAWTSITGSCNAHLDELKGPVGGGTGTYEYIVWNPPGPGTANMAVLQFLVRPNLANMRSRRAFEGFSV